MKSSGPQVMRYDRYVLSVQEALFYMAEGAGACALVSYTFYRSLALFLVLLPIGLCYPWHQRQTLMRRRLEQLNQEFKEGAMVLAGALAAGYSVENAFSNSLRELKLLYGEQSLIGREFAYLCEQMGMNRPVEQVLWEFGQRSGLEDIQNFAEVFSVAKRSGGDLVSILNHTAQVIADKSQVREEIRTMTASKQFEQRIMNLIPFLIVFYVDMTSPGFFGMMYATAVGRVIMTVCLAVYGAAYWMAGRILDIHV